MKYFLLIFLYLISGMTLANPYVLSCDETVGVLPVTPQTKVVVANCSEMASGLIECMAGLRMKTKLGQFIFSGITVEREKNPKVYLELETFLDMNEDYVGTRLMGEFDFIEGLLVYTGYENDDGCTLTALQKMNYDNEKNELKLTVVSPNP